MITQRGTILGKLPVVPGMVIV